MTALSGVIVTALACCLLMLQIRAEARRPLDSSSATRQNFAVTAEPEDQQLAPTPGYDDVIDSAALEHTSVYARPPQAVLDPASACNELYRNTKLDHFFWVRTEAFGMAWLTCIHLAHHYVVVS